MQCQGLDGFFTKSNWLFALLVHSVHPTSGLCIHEGRVHDDAEAFHLQIGLVQGLKGASVINVMVEQDGKVGVCDGSDKGCVFSRGRE